MTSKNPKDSNALTRVGLIIRRFSDMDDDDAVAAVATADGGVARLTYGDLKSLLTQALDTGDRLQRISTWHGRETGPGGMVGDYCIECETRWPCDTRKMADGTYTDDDD